ncbi:hypothetical protein L1286_20585 [Pseudoalteromonas sp. SMS1]|uniref:hypothetical protein n=1 Tax=Pseudoalteromonas sp. SMS1 TaxID=2908894 RepID=UPI001F414F29|nr:hypothetical protein [Pseudoalteromonas sp. SMS1]MCF2859885.1 hypothetical protein [Pseudoalteromonas sp. SMS1]
MIKSTMLATSVGIVLGYASTAYAAAPACSVKTVVTDKCTVFPNSSSVNTQLNKYIGDLHTSCNRHDIAYNTLGKDKAAADRKLRNDLRKDCLDNPITATACLAVVEIAYNIVKGNVGHQFYNARQNEMLAHVQSTDTKLKRNTCLATPEQQRYVDSNLLTHITNKFQSITKRKPSAFEEFDMLSKYIPSQGHNGTSFNNYITSYAYNRKGVNTPVINSYSFDESAHDFYSYTFYPHLTNGSNATYNWRVNLGAKTTKNYEYVSYNDFDSNVTLNGYLYVYRSMQERDVMFINKSFTAKGACGPSPEHVCNVPGLEW